MRKETILASAQFDPRLPSYFLLQALFFLVLPVLTIPLIPVWALVGRNFHRRQYQALGCDLTGRSLNIRRGVLFKIEKNIPLDKITDLAVREGPVLKFFGLCSLMVETAGGGQGSSMGHAFLPGVVDALEFRDKVLDQRDLAVGGPTAFAAATVAQTPSDAAVLVEIRDTLQRIEIVLADRC